jgi:tetratricopeptide (TPR) repeat protein
MSSAVSPAYPSLLLSNRKNGSRYLWSAPLVMLAFGRQTGDNQADLDYIESQEHTVLERLEQDIHERKPKLVMIEYYPAIGPNLFALVARRGLLQNDLSAYKRLGICNRFVGFLYQGAPQSPLIGTQSDLTVKPGKDSPKNSNNPAQMPDLNFGEGRVEQFRLASATIARADRTILLNPTGEAYLSRGRAYASISMHQQAVSNFERAKGYSGPSAKEADIAIRQDPEIPAGYLERAWNFNQQKRFKEALQLADLAIKKDYALVDAHLCRASALRGLHEPAAASEQIIADCLRGSKE